MLRDYFGAPDTDFIRGVSRIVMIASCRRIFEPGAKFDYMTVLESPEGFNKSSALAELYGPEWFSDQTILRPRRQATRRDPARSMVHRMCGLERHAKSRSGKGQSPTVSVRGSHATSLRARGHRRAALLCLLGNDKRHRISASQTGNRRFFPVPVGRIDVAALRRDRDLLWGEAMAAHLTGESIMLPEPLWAAAAIEQEARTYKDPWADFLPNVAELAEALHAIPGIGR